MPDSNDRRPRITRTTSVFPGSFVGPVYRNDVTFIPAPSVFAGRAGTVPADVHIPSGYEVVRRTPQGVYIRPKQSSGTTEYRPYGPYAYEVQQQAQRLEQQRQQSAQSTSDFRDRLLGNISRTSTTDVTATGEQTASVYGPLNLADIPPDTVFLFDRGAIVNPETGSRTGVLQSRGVYGSADSLERQLPAGQTVTSGTNENRLTIAAGVLWLRNLAARDPEAYNRLVVLLRNAGYGQLPSNDAELPLNGYSQQVGVAFALAANDLAQAGQGGDNRTLLEYLTDRGKGYADYLAQQEADQAAADAYKPTDRKYTDPASLRAAAKAAAVHALGRSLTDEEEARFEASFRSQEDSFYDQIDKAGKEKGVFRGYEPDPSGQIEAYLDEPQFETEQAANRIGQYANAFLSLIGGGR